MMIFDLCRGVNSRTSTASSFYVYFLEEGMSSRWLVGVGDARASLRGVFVPHRHLLASEDDTHTFITDSKAQIKRNTWHKKQNTENILVKKYRCASLSTAGMSNMWY